MPNEVFARSALTPRPASLTLLAYRPIWRNDREVQTLATITELTAETFDAAVASGVSLIDFWATWCGPCKLMGAVLESQVAPELGDDVTVGKVNIEEQSDLAVRFEVLSVPTLVIFKDGEPVETLVGVQKPADLVEKVKKLIG